MSELSWDRRASQVIEHYLAFGAVDITVNKESSAEADWLKIGFLRLPNAVDAYQVNVVFVSQPVARAQAAKAESVSPLGTAAKRYHQLLKERGFDCACGHNGVDAIEVRFFWPNDLPVRATMYAKGDPVSLDELPELK